MIKKNIKRICWKIHTMDSFLARKFFPLVKINYLQLQSFDTAWTSEDQPQSFEVSIFVNTARELQLLNKFLSMIGESPVKYPKHEKQISNLMLNKLKFISTHGT